MYDNNGILDGAKARLLLSSYPVDEMISLILNMCEGHLHRAVNSCFALGARRPSEIPPEEIREFEAYLTPVKRDEIANTLLLDIEAIKKILFLAVAVVDKQAEKKNQKPEG